MAGVFTFIGTLWVLSVLFIAYCGSRRAGAKSNARILYYAGAVSVACGSSSAVVIRDGRGADAALLLAMLGGCLMWTISRTSLGLNG